MFGGYPNIEGETFAQSDIGFSQTSSNYTGSFVAGKRRENKLGTFSGYGSYDFCFDASRSSQIYSGSEIQVPALQALVCIKF